MSPKTTPNAERPSADKLAASAGRAVASPAVSDKGPIPAIVEALHLKSSRKRRQARADLAEVFPVPGPVHLPAMNLGPLLSVHIGAGSSRRVSQTVRQCAYGACSLGKPRALPR